MLSQVFKSWAIAEIRSLCSVLARWMTEPCYPSVAVITVASVLHRKQLLFSSQPVRLAYLWVNIPSYTHPYKSRQPKPARKSSAQFEVCCTHFFQYLQAWHLTCQKHCSCWLSVVLPQFLKIISVVLPAWHRDRGMRRIQLFGVVLSLYSMCFPSASLLNPFYAQRGWTLGDAKTAVCKCALKTALVFCRLLFWLILCTMSTWCKIYKEVSPHRVQNC